MKKNIFSLKTYITLITIGILLLPFLDKYFNTSIAPKDAFILSLYWILSIIIFFLLHTYIMKKNG